MFLSILAVLLERLDRMLRATIFAYVSQRFITCCDPLPFFGPYPRIMIIKKHGMTSLSRENWGRVLFPLQTSYGVLYIEELLRTIYRRATLETAFQNLFSLFFATEKYSSTWWVGPDTSAKPVVERIRELATDRQRAAGGHFKAVAFYVVLGKFVDGRMIWLVHEPLSVCTIDTIQWRHYGPQFWFWDVQDSEIWRK